MTARLLRHARDDKELILNRIAEMWRQYADGHDEEAYQIFRELRQKWKNEQKGRRLVCEFEKKAQEAEDLSQKWDRICEWYKKNLSIYTEDRGGFMAGSRLMTAIKDPYGKYLKQVPYIAPPPVPSRVVLTPGACKPGIQPLSMQAQLHQYVEAVTSEAVAEAVKEVEYPYKKQIEDLVEAGFVKLL